MIAGIVLLIGLMLLATQLMAQGRTGTWPSITLASEFNMPADRAFTDWIILDRPIQFVLADVQLWIVLVFTAALIYWVADWTNEQLGRLSKSPPPLEPAPPPEPAPPTSELADSGTPL